MRFSMPADVGHVAKTFGRQHPCLRAFVLDESVRRDGRAVEDLVDLRRVDTGTFTYLDDTADGRSRRIVSRRYLVYVPFCAVDKEDVGVGSPNVHADTDSLIYGNT